MADSTNLSVFGQASYFNEKVTAFKGIETPDLSVAEIRSSSGSVNVSGDLNTTGNIGVTSIYATYVVGTSFVGVFPTGTTLLFHQAAAPTGWTKLTTHDNKALRVVSGTGGGSGGATNFTTAFASGRSVSSTTLTTSQIPAHTHQDRISIGIDDSNFTNGQDASINLRSTSDRPVLSFYGTTESTGGGGSHNHTVDLDVQYIDIILCSKD